MVGKIENRERETFETQPRLRVVTPRWIKAHKRTVEQLRSERENNPDSDTILIIPAAQHPLVNGIVPGLEFLKRLEAAKHTFEEIIRNGGRAELFLTGNRAKVGRSGQSSGFLADINDGVTQYDAAGRWLVDHDVPPTALHGKEWIDAFRPRGIYSTADEIAVAAAGFTHDIRYRSAMYICSGGQVSRAKIYALAYKLPLSVVVPQELRDGGIDQFHSPSFKTLALDALTMTIDPYGERPLLAMVRDRLPDDYNIDTVPELLARYSDMPWYQQAED